MFNKVVVANRGAIAARVLRALYEMKIKSVAVYSFGKALHATGLRVGYAVAPPDLTTELRKVHQFNTFTIATPLQHAIARYLVERPDAMDGLSAFFQRRHDLLADLLAPTSLRVLPSTERTFLCCDPCLRQVRTRKKA